MRDRLLRRPVQDLDFISDRDLSGLARKVSLSRGGRLKAFGDFGTLRLHLNGGIRVDFSRARTETYPGPAALPQVRPAASVEEDLKRRDFTINAMALPARQFAQAAGADDPLIDPWGGLSDLRAGRLRVLHCRSFEDDPTRIFRAARFMGRLGFRLEKDTGTWLCKALEDNLPSLLSRERLRNELLKILEEKNPEPALRLLRGWGLLKLLHPKFRWTSGCLKASSALERLGLIALEMRRRDFLRGLNLDRPDRLSLEEALDVAETQASPRAPLSELALKVLKRRYPRKKKTAFQPCLLTGRDLIRAGLKPGKEFKGILARAARAQWQGKVSTRSHALRWLRRP